MTILNTPSDPHPLLRFIETSIDTRPEDNPAGQDDDRP